MPIDPVDNMLSRLHSVKKMDDNQWMASCPCRDDDQNPSLAVSRGKDGECMVYCHRGMCNAEKIFQSVGLNLAKDGFVRDEPPREAKKKSKKLVKTYTYRDEDGNVLYEKLRYLVEDGTKSFSHRRPDPSSPGNYIYNLKDTRKVLYRLPEVIASIAAGEDIWLVEGEKDADIIYERYGIPATTMTNGANSWDPSYTLTLAGAANVHILADNDDVGKLHAIGVRDDLMAAGINAIAWVSKHAKDAYDHIQAGYEVDGDSLKELTDKDLPESVVIEDIPEDEAPEESAEDRLLEEITKILNREQMEFEQKLNRISFALNNFSATSFEDYGRTVNWQEFLTEADNDTYEWVIPGLLEKQERVIVVAAEGVGKTMLARQVAIASAAGLHPFTFQPMRPIRTLTIDLENPARIIRRTSRSIMENAIRLSHAKTVDAHLHIHPSGLDLTSTKDRIFVEQLVEQVRPQLICLGPLYKSYVDNGSRTSEALAIEVAKFLDRIRDVYDCALWLEHHAPLGSSMTTRELRPFGSSVWSRWPEFGISITPDPLSPEGYVYDVRHFRGARDKRAWPIKMKRSLRLPFEVIEFMKE
jgi:hypothetical protein